MTNAITPLVYGLLIGKSAEDYNLFFEKVFKQDNFQPDSNMTDFETGTIKSVKDLLPNILHKGCLIHFSQTAFRLNVKQLIALAFAPLDQIITGFDLICDQFDDDADDLLEHFEKTCIDEPKISGNGHDEDSSKPRYQDEESLLSKIGLAYYSTGQLIRPNSTGSIFKKYGS
ncbi:unnamed protein product [Rotaria magnacalcarata]|nr:unnamed protein product [Rotaria magnacalcarata]